MPFSNIYNEKKTRVKALTSKQIEWVDLYMVHQSATKATEHSSYKCDKDHWHRLGQKLMAHPLIREEIKKRQAERSRKFEVTTEYLVEELVGIHQKCKEDNNPTASLRAIELLGKTIAAWKDRQEITGADGEAIKHEQKIEEHAADFTRRISSLVKRAGTDNVVEFPESGGASKT